MNAWGQSFPYTLARTDIDTVILSVQWVLSSENCWSWTFSSRGQGHEAKYTGAPIPLYSPTSGRTGHWGRSQRLGACASCLSPAGHPNFAGALGVWCHQWSQCTLHNRKWENRYYDLSYNILCIVSICDLFLRVMMMATGLGTTSVIFAWIQKIIKSLGSWRGEKCGAGFCFLIGVLP